jgi:hypothetical protein
MRAAMPEPALMDEGAHFLTGDLVVFVNDVK